MRRLFAIAVATLVPLLAAVPALAQHGGGHASAGGHGGMAAHGSFGGHASSGHAMGGMHSSPGVRGLNRGSAFSRPGFSSRNSFRNFNRSRGPFIHTFNRNCFGCRRFGWPWWGAYDPFWGDSGSSYDQDYEQDRGYAEQMNQQSLEEQRMRQQPDQDLYARSAPPQPREETHSESPVPPTVLVFRDQHKKEVQNYAIVGQTLWNFASQRTEKIPLADLDLAATTKANDERGVDFRVPGTSEGQ